LLEAQESAEGILQRRKKEEVRRKKLRGRIRKYK
jgi:hypothetical protein